MTRTVPRGNVGTGRWGLAAGPSLTPAAGVPPLPGPADQEACRRRPGRGPAARSPTTQPARRPAARRAGSGWDREGRGARRRSQQGGRQDGDARAGRRRDVGPAQAVRPPDEAGRPVGVGVPARRRGRLPRSGHVHTLGRRAATSRVFRRVRFPPRPRGARHDRCPARRGRRRRPTPGGRLRLRRGRGPAADGRGAARRPELAAMVDRRVAGFPLEHVLGWVEFCGLRIAVDPGVFVPRRRTEFLVREAASLARWGAVVVDLCCGTGAVGVALAAAVARWSCTPLISIRSRSRARAATSQPSGAGSTRATCSLRSRGPARPCRRARGQRPYVPDQRDRVHAAGGPRPRTADRSRRRPRTVWTSPAGSPPGPRPGSRRRLAAVRDQREPGAGRGRRRRAPPGCGRGWPPTTSSAPPSSSAPGY